MDRRLAGAALLGVMLLSSAVFPRLSNAGMPGHPQVATQVQPQFGDCVVQADRVVQVVSCATRHNAEVTLVRPADLVTGQQQRVEFMAACTASVAQYVGLEPADPTANPPWLTSELNVSAVTAPRGRPTSVGSGSHLAATTPPWRACLVRPSVPVPGYVGSIRGMTGTGTLPLDLRSCYLLEGSAPPDLTDTPCTDRHHGEIIASRTVAIPTTGPGSPADDRTLIGECRTLVADRVGVDDPTFGGRLAPRLAAAQIGFVSPTTGQAQPFSAGPPRPPKANQVTPRIALFRLTCSVELTGPEYLTNSLVDLGSRPLPVQ